MISAIILDEIVESVLVEHNDFSYAEVEEICNDYLSDMPVKIKEDTKIKRLKKFVEKVFELNNDNDFEIISESTKKYSLESIPKYLFSGKTKIVSGLINVIDLSKNIEQTYLFDKANLKLNTTDKVALIGKNGSGKTTLLKMIIGKEEITDGKIETNPNIKIGYLSQDLFWKSEKNTLREEMLAIFPEITKKIVRLEELKGLENNSSEITSPLAPLLRGEGDNFEEIERLNKELVEVDGFKKYKLQFDILKYFGFTEEQMDFNVLSLSGGEQTKVQIAKFLIQEVDLLILDEPTNHLDINGIIFLEHFCQNWKKAILSISHDIRFIDNTSNRIAEISNLKINNYPGNYSKYLKEKQERYDKELRDFNNQKKEIDKETAYINRFRANSAKASSVQSRIKALDKIEILIKPIDEKTVRAISIDSDKRLPEIIMKLKNIEVGYNVPIVTLPKDLEVYKSDKIGIIGKNGAGKTTLLKTILGELKALNGVSEINDNINIGSYSQVLEDLDTNISIISELGRDYENEREIRTILGGLLITGDKVEQVIGTLSGGERAKVGLTKMLLTKPDIIIMDEPTNHLDLHSKEVIKKMLESFKGTTLIVSHDRDLLESVSNKVWLIKDKKLEIYNEPEKGFEEAFRE